MTLIPRLSDPDSVGVKSQIFKPLLRRFVQPRWFKRTRLQWLWLQLKVLISANNILYNILVNNIFYNWSSSYVSLKHVDVSSLNLKNSNLVRLKVMSWSCSLNYFPSFENRRSLHFEHPKFTSSLKILNWLTSIVFLEYRFSSKEGSLLTAKERIKFTRVLFPKISEYWNFFKSFRPRKRQLWCIWI